MPASEKGEYFTVINIPEQAMLFSGTIHGTPMKTTYFCYEEGRHFHLPSAMKTFFGTCQGFGRADFFLPDWKDSTGRDLVRAEDPRDADFILFPYDIGWLVDAQGPAGALAFLRGLPYFAEHESRHVFVDHGDSMAVVGTDALLFKVSLSPGPVGRGVVQIWYRLPEHVARSGYTFSQGKKRYDISFVGTNTNRVRQLVIAMLRRERRLRSFFDLVDGDVRDGLFCASSARTSSVDRQALFRNVAADSLAMLCLPGLGPLSVRLFEAMFFGRIPVVLKDFGRLPFEDSVAYERFCIFISRNELPNIGEALWTRLQARRHEHGTMCQEACATWHRHFSDTALHRHMCRSVEAMTQPVSSTATKEEV